MRNLNLYNYYDKSLAEINKDYLSLKDAKKSKSGKGSKGKHLALILLAVLVLSTSVGIYIFTKSSVTTQETVVPTVAQKPDLRSTEEKLGYIKVQIFEFADEAPETARPNAPIKENLLQNAEIPAPAEKAPETAKTKETPAPAKKEIASKAETTKTAAPVKKYSVTFEGIDPKEYDTVNSIALKYKFTPEITDSFSVSKAWWRVYRVEPSSKTVIGGKNVEKVKDFVTKEEAVAYARENNIQSVIRLEEETDKTYTLKLCCGDLDTSKKLAEDCNIRNKTIKIIREK